MCIIIRSIVTTHFPSLRSELLNRIVLYKGLRPSKFTGGNTYVYQIRGKRMQLSIMQRTKEAFHA